MGLINFIKSKSNKRNERELIFLEEVRLATIKYLCSPLAKLNLKDRKGHPTNFIEAFPKVYSKCSKIKSPWDRRSVIFSKLDEVFKNEVPEYIYANRLIEDRYPQKALEILIKSNEPKENKYVYYAVFAKALTMMGEYSEAISKAQKALRIKHDYNKAKVILADAYYLSGRFDEAEKIYSEMLIKYLEETIDELSGNLNIVQLFGAEFERLRSPIFAIKLLKENDLLEDAWKWAEDEFYYSPYFRCQHAYWILEKESDVVKAFSKLLALFKEMPWEKEAAINIVKLIEKIDPNGDKEIAKEDVEKVRKIVKQNGWTEKNMYMLTIN